MDPLWIIVAFILGFAVKQIGLPPLVGFLAAGFVLNALGVEGGETLDKIAEFGVLLLLFSIGLKLKVKSLIKPEIWATSSLHLLLIVIIFSAGLFSLSFTGLSIFSNLLTSQIFLIAFALSFSSTVFAVKILEENGAMTATHGRIAVGILIMQDIFAVIFLTISSGQYPSPWAFALIALLLLPVLLKKSVLSTILNRSGHGELLVLLGVLIPIGAAYVFKLVGLKPDLGALALGILLAGHPKAEELSKAMLSFKDIFLVGFFLTIGLSGMPSVEDLGVAALLIVALPIKIILFFLLITRFKLRARTATLSSLSLATYSEFGLIVGAAGVANGWLGNEWLIIFAVALSMSFILASPLNMISQTLYERWQNWLQRFETETRLPEDEPLQVGDAEVVVLGMGRIGTSIYDLMNEKYDKSVLGIDYNEETVLRHLSKKRNVIHGDAVDVNFWMRVQPIPQIQLIMLAASDHSTHMQVIDQLKKFGGNPMIAAISRYDDEIDELKQAGVQVVFNLYSEAGAGYAEHVYQIFAASK